MLKPGDKIPTNIKLLDEKSQETTLKKYLGKAFILYFYPKDNTSGCTLEAKNFDALWSDFKKLGYRIIGVSKDSPESHVKFKNKHELAFDLLSDPESELQKAFGVWQEKRMFGKSYMGTIRSTFLVDEKGKIIESWLRVKPQDHPQQVLQYLQENDS